MDEAECDRTWTATDKTENISRVSLTTEGLRQAPAAWISFPFHHSGCQRPCFTLYAEMLLHVLQRCDFPRLYPDFIPPLLSLCTNYLQFLHEVRILFLADTAHPYITPKHWQKLSDSYTICLIDIVAVEYCPWLTAVTLSSHPNFMGYCLAWLSVIILAVLLMDGVLTCWMVHQGPVCVIYSILFAPGEPH